MAAEDDPWFRPLITAVRAGAFMLAHALTACVIIVTLTIVSALLKLVGEPKLFGRFPLSYVFDGIDVIMLVAFGAFGIIDAIKVFRGSGRGRTESK